MEILFSILYIVTTLAMKQDSECNCRVRFAVKKELEFIEYTKITKISNMTKKGINYGHQTQYRKKL